MKPTLARITTWAWLALITVLPLSFSYVYREPVAVSYLGLFSVIVIVLAGLCLLTGQLQFVKPSPRSLTVAIVLMALMLIWGSLWSEPLRSIVGPWTNRFLLPLAVGYVGYLLMSQGRLTTRSLAAALCTSLALLAAYGILQAAGVIDSHNISRVTGPYAFPNSYARVIEILLIVLFPFLLLENERGRVFGWLTWSAGLVALVLTYSYGGFGSFLFGLAILITLLPSRLTWLKGVTLATLVLVVAGGLMFRQELPKYQATIGSSLATRQQFWHVAWETVKVHPLTGIGLEGWENQYLGLARHYLVNEQGEAIIETVSAQPHNVYLDALLRAGLLGLVAVGYLLLWPIHYALKQLRRSDEASWLVYAGAGLGVALVIFGLVDDPIFADEAITIVLVLYFAIAASGRSARSATAVLPDQV